MDNPWADPWPDSGESDLAVPSWSTDLGVRWAEPDDPRELWNSEQHEAADSQTETAPATTPSPKQDSSPPSPTRSPSPGEFDTFETADANASFPQDSLPWDVQPWAPSEDAEDAEDQPSVDEWEIAKLQKQKQDQHVPPELLAGILEQLKELSSNLWPVLEDGETRQPSKDFLSDVPSLKPAVDKLVPDDLFLSANVQFARTFTFKNMNEALRLTRHLPITLSSPMSIYMASKGSTAWETFVKSKQDIGQDDILPLGWRMVEKNTREPTPAPEVKRKATGGLLSFLGLKSSDTTTEPQKPSPSPSRPASLIGSIQSPKSSLDGSSKPDSERRWSLSQPSAPSSATSNASPSILPSVSSQDTEQKMVQEPAQQTAPSAVSRFFGRFSRSSTASTNSSRSLALSSDDIEFLSDIVPSAHDDAVDDENLTSFTNVISAKSPSSLSATPLPQPLPPPPKFSHPGPASALQANAPFSLLDALADEQPLTSAESTSIQSLVPTLPSIHASTKPTSTPPIISNPRMKSSPQRRNFTAVMTSSGRSTPSNLQAPLPPPPLPPPPNSIINPPQSQPLVPVQQPQKQLTSLFDDDEFSDFLSSPAEAGHAPQPSLLQTLSSNTPRASIVHRIDAPSSIGSFSNTLSEHSILHWDVPTGKNSSRKSNHHPLQDEFVSSTLTPPLRTPTPPRPPAKTTGQIKQPPPPGPKLMPIDRDRESLPPPPPQKISRAADHARTLSLLETASARPGRWPAPPSPLPQALAPPPPPPPSGASASSKSRQLNIFDDGLGEVAQLSQTGGKVQPQSLASNTLWNSASTPGSSSATSSLSLPLRAISPPLAPSKANGGVTLSNPSLWSLGANGGGKPLTPVAGSGNKPTGGLSAQDLSFFEGL